MQDYELDAYLDGAEVTDGQRRRLLALGDTLDEGAFADVVAYMLGDLTLADVGARLGTLRAAQAEALATARAVAVVAVEGGVSEAGAARALGVDRMAVRGWLGKR